MVFKTDYRLMQVKSIAVLSLTGLDFKKIERKIVNISYPSALILFLPMCLYGGVMSQDDTITLNKYGFIETVLLSTHNICFGREIRKLFFGTSS